MYFAVRLQISLGCLFLSLYSIESCGNCPDDQKSERRDNEGADGGPGDGTGGDKHGIIEQVINENGWKYHEGPLGSPCIHNRDCKSDLCLFSKCANPTRSDGSKKGRIKVIHNRMGYLVGSLNGHLQYVLNQGKSGNHDGHGGSSSGAGGHGSSGSGGPGSSGYAHDDSSSSRLNGGDVVNVKYNPHKYNVKHGSGSQYGDDNGNRFVTLKNNMKTGSRSNGGNGGAGGGKDGVPDFVKLIYDPKKVKVSYGAHNVNIDPING